MKEEEIVIRYRIPSIPAGGEAKGKRDDGGSTQKFWTAGHRSCDGPPAGKRRGAHGSKEERIGGTDGIPLNR